MCGIAALRGLNNFHICSQFPTIDHLREKRCRRGEKTNTIVSTQTISLLFTFARKMMKALCLYFAGSERLIFPRWNESASAARKWLNKGSEEWPWFLFIYLFISQHHSALMQRTRKGKKSPTMTKSAQKHRLVFSNGRSRLNAAAQNWGDCFCVVLGTKRR